jgi:hypothetical protein
LVGRKSVGEMPALVRSFLVSAAWHSYKRRILASGQVDPASSGRNRRMRYLMLLLSLVVIEGCSRDQVLQKFSSPEDQATARGYIDRLRGP